MRGVDYGQGRDPGPRFADLPGQSSGDEVGSLQDDEFLMHRHSISTGASPNPNGGCGFEAMLHSASIYAESGGTCSGQAVAYAGGAETRPKNAYVNYIVKY